LAPGWADGARRGQRSDVTATRCEMRRAGDPTCAGAVGASDAGDTEHGGRELELGGDGSAHRPQRTRWSTRSHPPPYSPIQSPTTCSCSSDSMFILVLNFQPALATSPRKCFHWSSFPACEHASVSVAATTSIEPGTAASTGDPALVLIPAQTTRQHARRTASAGNAPKQHCWDWDIETWTAQRFCERASKFLSARRSGRLVSPRLPPPLSHSLFRANIMIIKRSLISY
jgi:hypothetical protein